MLIDDSGDKYTFNIPPPNLFIVQYHEFYRDKKKEKKKENINIKNFFTKYQHFQIVYQSFQSPSSTFVFTALYRLQCGKKNITYPPSWVISNIIAENNVWVQYLLFQRVDGKMTRHQKIHRNFLINKHKRANEQQQQRRQQRTEKRKTETITGTFRLFSWSSL